MLNSFHQKKQPMILNIQSKYRQVSLRPPRKIKQSRRCPERTKVSSQKIHPFRKRPPDQILRYRPQVLSRNPQTAVHEMLEKGHLLRNLWLSEVLVSKKAQFARSYAVLFSLGGTAEVTNMINERTTKLWNRPIHAILRIGISQSRISVQSAP